MLHALVAEIGAVALVAYVADQVGPGDAVSAFDEPWMGNWAKRFTNVRGVSDITVGGEEDSAGSACIGCVTKVGVCGLIDAGRGSGWKSCEGSHI